MMVGMKFISRDNLTRVRVIVFSREWRALHTTCQKVLLGQEDLWWSCTSGHRIRSVIQLITFQHPHRCPFCLPWSSATDNLPNHPLLRIHPICRCTKTSHLRRHCNVLKELGRRLWSGTIGLIRTQAQHSTASEHGLVMWLPLIMPRCTHVRMYAIV